MDYYEASSSQVQEPDEHTFLCGYSRVGEGYHQEKKHFRYADTAQQKVYKKLLPNIILYTRFNRQILSRASPFVITAR